MKRRELMFWMMAMLIAIVLVSCTRHDVNVAPVEIKPIHITIDVNVKIDRELDSFFDDIDSAKPGKAVSDEADTQDQDQ